MKTKSNYEEALEKVKKFMRWIRNSHKARSMLDLVVDYQKGFKAILSNQIRWTSKFRMTERFLKYMSSDVDERLKK